MRGQDQAEASSWYRRCPIPVVASVLMAALGCGGTTKMVGPTVPTSLRVEGAPTLVVAQSRRYTARAWPGRVSDVSAEVQWRSSAPSVLTIVDGVATGVAEGSAYVEAEWNGMTARTYVVVRKPLPPGIPSGREPPPAEGATASLAIEGLVLHQLGPGHYAPAFTLRETTGRSSALIVGLWLEYGRGWVPNDPYCWVREFRVRSGGTLDPFAGAAGLRDCAPDVITDTPSMLGQLIVVYRDDDGRIGRAEMPIPPPA